MKVFRSDNGGEYIGAEFARALEECGIQRQLASPYAHQQNGKAKHAICTLEGRAFAMLEAAGLSSNLWGEAVLTAAYLWNRMESVSLPPGVTPYELVNGQKPDLSHIRVFGSCCWARIPTELQMKFGPHSRRAIFLGYPNGTKGYRVHDAENGSFFIACDVVFEEKLPALVDIEDDDEQGDDDDTGPDPIDSPPHPTPTTIPVIQPSPASPTNDIAAPRRPSCVRLLMQAGQAYAEEQAATQIRLEALWDKRNAAATEISDEGAGPLGSSSKRVEEEDANSLKAIEPDPILPDATTGVVMKQQAHIMIRSDRCRDPMQPAYDMAVPPATYKETVQRADKDRWLEAMKTELQIMRHASL